MASAIRHCSFDILLMHAANCADFTKSERYSPTSLEKHLKSLWLPDGNHYQQAKHFLAQQPATKRQYSNLAAGLAGYLIEATAGMSLAQFSKQRLFPALDMTHSSCLGVFTAMYFDPVSKDGFIILMNRGMDAKAVAAMQDIAQKMAEIE